MPTITGNSGSNGTSGADGANGTTASVPGGNGGNATAGGDGQDMAFAMTQANFDSSLRLVGGAGGTSGDGGRGGDGGITSTNTYGSHDFLVRTTTSYSTAGAAGQSSRAGSGGDSSVEASNLTAANSLTLEAFGGVPVASGGRGGDGGNGHTGQTGTNPYANGYFDNNNVLHYVGFSESSPGSPGRNGAAGSRGGDGGAASVTATHLNLTSEAAFTLSLFAEGGYASGGGAGGWGGYGRSGGDGAAGGNGGNGGSASVYMSDSSAGFPGEISLTARAGAGGIGRNGGNGGLGQVHHYSYTAPGTVSTSDDFDHGLGGAGGSGGSGGSADIHFLNNHMTGTAADEHLSLSFSLKSGDGGTAGLGGADGGGTVFAANGTAGGGGATFLLISGNQIDGGDGTDQLTLRLYNEFASAAGYVALAPVYINLQNGVFRSGDGTNTVRNVENVYLDIRDFYYAEGAASDHGAGATLIGNGGANILATSRGGDNLSGLDGNDSLDGGEGADIMRGGTGDDTYYVDNVNDKVVEGNNQGTDTVYASATYAVGGQYVENVILTGAGNANLGGNGLANILTGNSGNNSLNGGAGSDTMTGGTGDDTYYVDTAGDVVMEDTDGGKDAVYSAISYTLGDNVETLVLSGFQAINGTGNGLDNTLTGNGNVNVLSGGGGRDILTGQGGNDILTGGAGADQFRFAAAGAANGLDHITDFVSGSDKLAFAGSDYGIARGHVLTATEFHTGPVAGGNAQFVYNTVNHTLYWDADGAGGSAAVAVITFDNSAQPVASDFAFL